MNNKQLEIFISYRWESDKHHKWVEMLANDLKNNGFSVNLDKWKVGFGDSFTDYMVSCIGKADVFLFIITDRTVDIVESTKSTGGAVKFELQMALSRHIAGEEIRIIPILRQGDKLVRHLRDRRYVDFRKESMYSKKLKELIMDIDNYKRKDIGTEHIKNIDFDNMKSWELSALETLFVLFKDKQFSLTDVYTRIHITEGFWNVFHKHLSMGLIRRKIAYKNRRWRYSLAEEAVRYLSNNISG